MAYTVRITLSPATADGRFRSDSFDHLLHQEVGVPGLDPTWAHTLVGAATTDGTAMELVIYSTPRAATSLDRGLRLATWQPPAHVKAHDEDGTELAVSKLNAPLAVGEPVEVNGTRYRVHEATWPHRDPDSGTCHEGLDYQHVTLVADPQPAHEPTAAR